MKRFLLLTTCLLLMSFSLVFSQTLTVDGYGVSPREADVDTLDIFDRAFNGLVNVGVGTQMYLVGTYNDSILTSTTWNILQQPIGSVAGLSAPFVMDSTSEVVVFTPDSIGTYEIEFADGATTASVFINAATYLGVGDEGGCSNAFCHTGKVADWEGTGHSDMLERGLDGEIGSYYASYCISCHTTGHDTNPTAVNDGFDDFPFTFPDTLHPGMYDSMFVSFPDAMERANIQCESCHGPGSAHNGNTSDNRMVSTFDVKNCALCHDSGTHHAFPDQWKVSSHGSTEPISGYAASSNSCGVCHNGEGFVQMVDGDPIDVNEYVPISCAVCHDPHSDANEHQLRTVEATLANGEVITGVGTGAICMNCHRSRREANSYSDEPHGHYGPHYMTQADMINATNVVTFGQTLPTSPHVTATGNACATCHMFGEHLADSLDNIIHVGGHTFNMEDPNGVDNVEACESCHGDVGTSFSEKKYYFNGTADHDGDGIEEGVQEEVHGLLDELGVMLPHADTVATYDPHDDVDSTWTKTELKAAFNYEMVYYDRSYGIHNPAFTVALLKVSITALENNALDGSIVAIDDVPNDQGKQVRIIWDKFVDDGVAVDPIVTYLVKRFDGDSSVWTAVGQQPAHGSMRYALVVPTLYDSTASGMVLTTFKVVAISQGGAVYESDPADGYSIDNLVPAAPANVAASAQLATIDLSWDEAIDEDFDYFAIYRGTTAGFDPSGTTPIATLTGLSFSDQTVTPGVTYYYKMSAFDFSGNESDYSDEVSALISGIEDEEGPEIPDTYVMAQNYPNPFNPTTSIKFGLPEQSEIKIVIYNILGKPVRTLAKGTFAAGYHTMNWNGRNHLGNQVGAGTYIYRLESKSTNVTKKMILIK
jgi:hypothetical protein